MRPLARYSWVASATIDSPVINLGKGSPGPADRGGRSIIRAEEAPALKKGSADGREVPLGGPRKLRSYSAFLFVGLINREGGAVVPPAVQGDTVGQSYRGYPGQRSDRLHQTVQEGRATLIPISCSLEADLAKAIPAKFPQMIRKRTANSPQSPATASMFHIRF